MTRTLVLLDSTERNQNFGNNCDGFIHRLSSISKIHQGKVLLVILVSDFVNYHCDNNKDWLGNRNGSISTNRPESDNRSDHKNGSESREISDDKSRSDHNKRSGDSNRSIGNNRLEKIFDHAGDLVNRLYNKAASLKYDHLDFMISLSRDIPELTDIDHIIVAEKWIGTCLPNDCRAKIYELESYTETEVAGLTAVFEYRPVRVPLYNTVAVGGTFDHLHYGHKVLLTMTAAVCSRRLICGVTGSNLLKNKNHPELFESLQQRKNSVKEFLSAIAPSIQHHIVEINDAYGPTATDPDIDALLVSTETQSGARSIMKIRQERSLKSLDVFTVSCLPQDDNSADVSEKMSSTAIRNKIFAQIQGGKSSNR